MTPRDTADAPPSSGRVIAALVARVEDVMRPIKTGVVADPERALAGLVYAVDPLLAALSRRHVQAAVEPPSVPQAWLSPHEGATAAMPLDAARSEALEAFGVAVEAYTGSCGGAGVVVRMFGKILVLLEVRMFGKILVLLEEYRYGGRHREHAREEIGGYLGTIRAIVHTDLADATGGHRDAAVALLAAAGRLWATL